MTLPVAILAGGLATRLRPITTQIPKSLVQVAGKPFAIHQLELLARHGITNVVFCVGYLGEQIQATLGDGRRWGMHLEYIFDGEKLLGTGGALIRAIPLLGETFFVLYGDSYLECDYALIERAFFASDKAGLMTVYQNDNAWDRSNVEYRGGYILHYDKKQRTPEMKHIDYGLGVLDASALADYTPDAALDLAEIYQKLLAQDQLAGFEVKQRFYEIGSLDGLAETDTYLRGKSNDNLYAATSARDESDRRTDRSECD